LCYRENGCGIKAIIQPQFYPEVIMFAFIIPAAIAVLSVWGIASVVVVSLRDGYRQAPTFEA